MATTTQANLVLTTKQVATLEKECAKNQPKIADVLKNLEAAVAKADGAMLDLYFDRIEDTSGLISDTLTDGKHALAAIAELRKDKAFLESKFDAVKDLTARVDGIKKRLSEQLVKLKDLEKRALKVRETLRGGQQEAVEKYAELEDRVNDRKKVLEKKQHDLKAQVAAADKAVAAGNQKALTDARVKIIAMNFSSERIALSALDRELAAFLQKYKSAGLSTDVNWLKDEVSKLVDVADAGDEQMKRLLKLGQIDAASPKAPARKPVLSRDEVAKIAKALGILPKDHERLGKVLNGFPYGKWPVELSALARALGLKETDGRKLVAKISGYEFVKKLYLIDV
jgi:predicted  nucleic acid-binding Zn-ribbon protein